VTRKMSYGGVEGAPFPAVALFEYVAELDYGAPLPFGDMVSVLCAAEREWGCAYPTDRKSLHNYANSLRRMLSGVKKNIRSARNVGYAVCLPVEQLGESHKHTRKARNQAGLAKRDILAADRNRLSPDDRVRADRSLQGVRNVEFVIDRELQRAREEDDLLRRTGMRR
jgi:hypothetical protein